MLKKAIKELYSILSIPIERFLLLESASTILLFFCTILALVFANTHFKEEYFLILNKSILGLSVLHWVNDALMSLFFFVVGMEIKREMREGELATLKKASLPLIAAIGGMIVPALVYFSLNMNGIESHGWGIPMATDIAFAVAILSIAGKRVPLSLKVFLLALAIVDDLGAVLVIALFYSKGISWAYLGFASLALIAIALLKRWRETSFFYYIPLGLAVWAAFLFSGVHATVAGVVLGFMMPVTFINKNKQIIRPVDTCIFKLHPVVSFVIMPLFALANAGVTLELRNLEVIYNHSIFQGIVFGLVLGKTFGIFGASYLAVRLGISKLPEKVEWKEIFGVSALGGIGFTMSLFISSLAFEYDPELFSKAGILVGSLVAGIIGWSVLRYIYRNK